MTPAMTNYNVNVQFDPATPQAGKPTNLSLIVTEQRVGDPIKQFDIIHDKLMHLIIVNSEDLSHFAHKARQKIIRIDFVVIAAL
jgi:hypothetical protein